MSSAPSQAESHTPAPVVASPEIITETESEAIDEPCAFHAVTLIEDVPFGSEEIEHVVVSVVHERPLGSAVAV